MNSPTRLPRRHTPVMSSTFVFASLFILTLASSPASAQPKPRTPIVRQGQQLTGIDGLRMLHKTGNFRDTEIYAYRMLWEDIRQPEVLYLLASSLEKLRKPQDAAVYYTLFLRALDESAKPGGTAAPPEVTKQRPFAERRLKALKQDEQALTATYAKKAAGKKFESPEKVDDAWMDNVTSDLLNLHDLYAWKLVGGRKDAKADWVHNTKGAMHRSGAKYVDEVEGRKGVLFTIPLKAKDSEDADQSNRDALEKLGHNSHLETRNVGGCKFLRVGARGYGFPFILKVIVDGKEVKSETVGIDQWSDLKVELPRAEAKAAPVAPAQKGRAAPKTAVAEGQRVVVELIVPEGQKWSEGVWIDYLDFFDD